MCQQMSDPTRKEVVVRVRERRNQSGVVECGTFQTAFRNGGTVCCCHLHLKLRRVTPLLYITPQDCLIQHPTLDTGYSPSITILLLPLRKVSAHPFADAEKAVYPTFQSQDSLNEVISVLTANQHTFASSLRPFDQHGQTSCTHLP